jgi:hypothetical protein
VSISRPGVIVVQLDNAGAWIASKTVKAEFTANGGETAWA